MLKPIRKFSTKLLLCLIFGILLPVGILFIVLSGTYRDLLKDEIRRNTENVLLLAWEELEDVFSRMVTLSTIINNDSMLIGALDDPALKEVDRLAIFMGTEGAGLGAKTIAGCDRAVRIPMAHGVDSLNVAAASAVAFWQLCPHVSNEYHYQPGLYH